MGIDPVSLGITIALNLATAAIAMSRTIEGPRLTDLEASVAEYGTPIPTVFGRDRVEAAAFFLEPIKEKKKKRKGKGGKYKEYTYFGTGAWVVADHEIRSYDQIFLDRHLAYDRITGENVIELNKSGYELQSFMRFYYGTADQDVDPRMQAFIEAEDGPDTCPAYLNVAYIFLEDVPLEKVGNHYPQVGVVLVGLGGTNDLIWSVDTDTHDLNVDPLSPAYAQSFLSVSPNGNYLMGGDPNDTSWVATLGGPSLVYQQYFGDIEYLDHLGSPTTSFEPWIIDDGGSVWGEGSISGRGSIVEATVADPDTLTLRYTWTNNGGQAAGLGVHLFFTFTLPDGSIKLVIFPRGDSINSNPLFFVATKGTAGLTEHNTGGAWYPKWAFQDDIGDVWITGTPRVIGGPISTVTFMRITDVTGSSPYPTPQTITGLPPNDPNNGAPLLNNTHAIGYVADGYFIGGWLGVPGDTTFAIHYLIKIALDGSAAFETRDISGEPIVYPNLYYNTPSPDHYFLFQPSSNRTQIELLSDLSYGSTVYDMDDWPPTGEESVGVIWVDSQSAWYGAQEIYLDPGVFDNPQGELYKYELPSGLSLATVLRYFSEKVGLIEGEDFDVSDTEDIPITGCHFTQGPVKAFTGPLCDLYDVDCRMHDFLVEFIKRDREAVALIETSQMVRNGDQPLYETWMINEADVARRLFLTFTDPEADFQPNTAVAQRNLGAVDSVKELPIDMRTTVLYRDDAKQRTEQMLRRFWYGRLQSKFSYSYADIAYEPGDKINVDFDGEIITLKIVKLLLTAGYVIDLELERDSPSLSNLSNSRGAEAVGHPPSQILIVGPTEGFILDIPQPFDAFEQSQPYLLIAAAPVDQDDFWAGADIGFSTTGGTEDFVAGFDGVTASDAATWGVVNDVLPSVDPAIIDWGSVIEITVQHGDLLPSTEAEVIADRSVNLALIGDELVQFIDAQIIDSIGESATYQLQGFVRAVQGTEWAMDGHVAGEQFLLLDTVHRHSVASSEIGVTRYYQSNSVGLGAEVGEITELHFTSAAHRPLSPVHTEVEYDEATGSHFVRWVRRSRINGSLNGADIPLGESYEEYKVVIAIDSGVERTELVTEAEFEYTSAMKAEDGVALDSFIFGTVQQRSPNLNLDGYPADFASTS